MQAPLYIRSDIGRDEDIQMALGDRVMSSKGMAGPEHCRGLWGGLPRLIQQAEGPFCCHILPSFW